VVLPEPDCRAHRREAHGKQNPRHQQGHSLQGCLCGREPWRTANRHHRRDRERHLRRRKEDIHRADCRQRPRQAMDSNHGLGQKEILDEESAPPELRAYHDLTRKVPGTQGQVHRPRDIREQRETRRQNPRRYHLRQGFQEVLQEPADTNEHPGNRKRRPKHCRP